jgi:phosphatidylglycerophosphatase A
VFIDHPGIVRAEMIGFKITMNAVPELNWQCFVAGFIRFRVFDIVKLLDKRLPSFFGTMLMIY